MKELVFVLRKTKTGKAQDLEGLVREIFWPGVIGQDLKISMLSMLNIVKERGNIPHFMRKANISTIPKKGKSRLHLQNERGIFLVNTVRGIFMRILYNRKSKLININMSDSNVGG